MSGSPNISVVITGVDRASKTIDAVNKRIASIRAPADHAAKSIAKFSDVTGLTSLGKGMRTVAQHSLQAFENLTRLAGPMGAITGAASVAGMAGLAAEWARLNSQLGFAAQRAGLASGQLNDLRGAAQLAGSSAQSLAAGMTTLNDNLFNATAGRAPEAVRAFSYLGIAFQDAAGHSRAASAVLPELADKLAAIKDPTMQATLATMILGGAAEDLAPFIRRGSAGIAEYVRVANHFNPVTDDMIDAANRLRVAQTELSLSVTGLGNSISRDLEPYLTPLLHGMAEWIHDHPKLAAEMVATATAITTFIGVLGSLRLAWFLVAGARTAAIAGGGAQVAAETAAAATGSGVAGAAGVAGGGLLARLAWLAPLLALGLTGAAGGEDSAFSERKNREFLANRRAAKGGAPAGSEPVAGFGPTAGSAPIAGTTGLAATPFGALISRGEGGYDSVNRGAHGGYAAGTEDLASKTVAEVMGDQAAGKYNAAGRYQIIATTLTAAANQLNLRGDEKFDQKLQDRIFEQFLAGKKRPQIANYLSGKSNDLRAAVQAASEEWASVADPDTGQSHYAGVGNNRASISVAEMSDALERTRAQQTAAGVGAPVPGIGGGTGGVAPETKLTGGAELSIKLGGFPPGTSTSASASGNMWSGAPRVEQAMPFGG